MGNPRFRQGIYLFALLTTSSGCQVFHSYKPVTVIIRDAETKQPIPNTEVDINYLHMLDPFAPSSSSGITGKEGLVHLKADSNGYRPIIMRANAPGYFGQERFLWRDDIPKIDRESKQGQPDCIFELFSDPRATVELIVPEGFQGLVRVNHQPLNEKDWIRGQRLFSACVPANGLVEVKIPLPLLHSRSAVEYVARYADGIVLNRVPHDKAFGMRWLTSYGDDQFYVVGTKKDVEQCEQFVYKRLSPDTVMHDETRVNAWVERQRNIK